MVRVHNTYGAHPAKALEMVVSLAGQDGTPSPLYFISGRGLPFCCTLNCESFMTLPADDGQGVQVAVRAYQFKVDVGGQGDLMIHSILQDAMPMLPG